MYPATGDGSTQGGDRRRAPRISFDSHAVVFCGGKPIPCRTLNLSASGLLVVPSVAARLSGSVRVDFVFPDRRGSLCLHARVVRRTEIDGSVAWGLAFAHMALAARTMLEEYVDAHVTRSPVLDYGDGDTVGQYYAKPRRERLGKETMPRVSESRTLFNKPREKPTTIDIKDRRAAQRSQDTARGYKVPDIDALSQQVSRPKGISSARPAPPPLPARARRSLRNLQSGFRDAGTDDKTNRIDATTIRLGDDGTRRETVETIPVSVDEHPDIQHALDEWAKEPNDTPIVAAKLFAERMEELKATGKKPLKKRR